MEDLNKEYEIVIYGAGAIGASIGAWLTPYYDKVYLLARGQNAEVMKNKGIIIYRKEKPPKDPIPVKIIQDLNEKPSTNVVIIAVKNYNLEEVAKDIYEKLGDKPIIIALQNGTENQKVLPKYFSKIMYGVIMISAWRDRPGIFGYLNRGYLILGTLDNNLQKELKEMSEILSRATMVQISKKIQDAIHGKMIFNLLNSILTLINHNNPTLKSISLLREIIVTTLNEGINIVQAAGYHEHSLPGFVPWKELRDAVNLPPEKADKFFSRFFINRGPNSMIQDMIIRQKGQSELEYLNGYFIKLANSLGIDAPFNKILYKLCKENFKKTPYQPLEPEEVYDLLK
ncbi:MAG: ketopantoate reductase family protein [Candidatus Odinarchaeota archaeon]